MYWLILGVLCALFAVAALILWQKWAAPWSQIEQLVSQVARGEAPSTFLVNGGAGPHRIGLALENIFAHQQELERQIAGRESGTQTILGAMQDGLLVVDARNRIMLMNQQFFKRLIHEHNPVARVNHEQAILHRAQNCLRAGLAPRDLPLEFLLVGENVLQRETDAVRACPTVYQKRGWSFTPGYLRNELLNL